MSEAIPSDSSHSGSNADTLPTVEHGGRQRVSFRQWLEQYFNWSWFTCTQSTGGIAILLSECPKRFDGLETIGVIIFIFDMALWLVFTGLMISRWLSSPSTFRRCFTQSPECFFFGSFWLSMATFIVCMQRYGVPYAGPWLIVTVRVLFWIYAAISLLSSTTQFVVIFKHTPVQAIGMNPAWFLLVFQTMLTGTIAAAIAADQPAEQRMPILVAGVAYQGFGWIGSLLILAWFLGRLMEGGWPPPSQAPGLFMPIGSVGYTIVALIGAARALPPDYGFTAAHPTAREVLLIVSVWVSVFMWVFGFWLFANAVVVTVASVFVKEEGVKRRVGMTFKNSWWAIIFPNVGFALGTVFLGQELESNAVLWVATAMVLLLVAFWLMDLFLMAKAVAVSLLRDSDTKLM